MDAAREDRQMPLAFTDARHLEHCLGDTRWNSTCPSSSHQGLGVVCGGTGSNATSMTASSTAAEDGMTAACSWRMKERMKTVSVALVVCLNVGVDPPDVTKTQPCARTECWVSDKL